MPKLKKTLTEKEVLALSKKPGAYAVGGVPGLVLRVRAGDKETSATWCIRNSYTNKNLLSMGISYPQVRLAVARDRAREVIKSLSNGVNPIAEAKEKVRQKKITDEENKKYSVLFGESIHQWLSWKVERGNLKNAEQWEYKEKCRIDKHLSPLFGRPVATLEPEDIADVLKPIWCTKAATADRLLSHLHGFFQWAMNVPKIRDRGVNPASMEWLKDLLPAQEKRKKERPMAALAPKDVPRLFETLRTNEDSVERMLQFAILTCVRSRNVREARWDQIQDEVWVLDAEDMKIRSNGQHMVPLSPEALKLLERQAESTLYPESPYIFPSDRDPERPFSPESMENLLKRLHVRSVRKGEEGFLDSQRSKVEGRDVIATPHGVSRASFKTWALDTRQDQRAVELILHHSPEKNAVVAAYCRDDSMQFKRDILQAWANFCLSKGK